MVNSDDEAVFPISSVPPSHEVSSKETKIRNAETRIYEDKPGFSDHADQILLSLTILNQIC